MPKGIFIKSEEWKEKQRVTQTGKKHAAFSIETKRKMRERRVLEGIKMGSKFPPPSRKGVKLSLKTRQKMSDSHQGRIHRWPISDATRQKMSDSHKGAKSATWAGGISKPNPYPREFNPSLKLKIRTRDGFKCVRCDKPERQELEELNRVLCVNHIDFDKNNCDEKNLNTLCLKCNIQINREREYWKSYFNSVLNKDSCIV